MGLMYVYLCVKYRYAYALTIFAKKTFMMNISQSKAYYYAMAKKSGADDPRLTITSRKPVGLRWIRVWKGEDKLLKHSQIEALIPQQKFGSNHVVFGFSRINKKWSTDPKSATSYYY